MCRFRRKCELYFGVFFCPRFVWVNRVSARQQLYIIHDCVVCDTRTADGCDVRDAVDTFGHCAQPHKYIRIRCSSASRPKHTMSIYMRSHIYVAIYSNGTGAIGLCRL